MNDNRSHQNTVGGGGLDRSIFHKIISLENLFFAWREFKKNKNKKLDIVNFSLNLENNIFGLQKELISGQWTCDGYTSFSIRDPKPRKIHKASVRDRVLYQAIHQVLYPIFDNDFIFDSYASRTGKGTHAGIDRLVKMSRKISRNYTGQTYALKCDIRKFFDSINHNILNNLLKEKIECKKTLDLLAKIIDTFHKISGKGLPLGNVTSQLFANVYMNKFDWFIKTKISKNYIRYCDDFVILDSSREKLNLFIYPIQKFLIEHLKLELHPSKVSIRSFLQGVDFLGAVAMPYHVVPRTKTKKRIQKKLGKMTYNLQNGKSTKGEFNQSFSSYLGHLSHTKSQSMRSLIHRYKKFVRDLP